MTKKYAVMILTLMLTGLGFAGTGGPVIDEDGKYVVCHKGKKTLHLGSLDARDDHIAHGDSDGPCPT